MAANRQTYIHTHVCNAVTLVWGSLRLAPNIWNSNALMSTLMHACAIIHYCMHLHSFPPKEKSCMKRTLILQQNFWYSETSPTHTHPHTHTYTHTRTHTHIHTHTHTHKHSQSCLCVIWWSVNETPRRCKQHTWIWSGHECVHAHEKTGILATPPCNIAIISTCIHCHFYLKTV